MSGDPKSRASDAGFGWTLGRLLALIREHPGTMSASIMLGVIAALCGLAWQIGIFYLIIAALRGDRLWPDSALALGAIALTLVLGRLCFLAATSLSHFIAIGVQRDLRMRIAEHLARVSLGATQRYGIAQLRQLILDDIEAIEDGIAHLIPESTSNFVAPIVMLPVLVLVDWRMALAAALPPVVGMLIMSRMMRGNADIARDYYEASARMARDAAELVTGLPTARMFNDANRALRRFEDSNRSHLATIERWTARVLSANGLLQVMMQSGLVVIMPFGLWLHHTGTLSLELLIFFVIFTPGLSTILTRFSNFANRFAQQREVLLRLDALLTEPVLPQPSIGRQIDDAEVRFEGVSFSRDGRYILDDIDLVLRPGTVTALVGASGAGKTTLVHLLLRFFDVDRGRITIGGVDIRDLHASDLYRTVGTVFQQAWLFSGTVADNLRLARVDATDEELWAALDAARAKAFVEKLPHGIETYLSEGGAQLSGGEKQRLAIARSLLRPTPILVLDEATSFADTVNELEIQRGLSALAHERTVLVIAHRLRSIADADQIIVLDEGRIIERGTHTALRAAGGRYAKFWSYQQDEDRIAVSDDRHQADAS
jgi:ABC-type multidrug transport system fused ATPase/permease subunit